MYRLQLTVRRPDGRHPRQILAHHFPFTIGRSLTNDLTLPAPSVSGAHLVVEPDGEAAVMVTDLGSTNGTRIGDAPLPAHQPRRLDLPATIHLGEIHLQIQSPEGDEQGFTRAESATELREMVDDVVRSDTSDDARPFFEILSGPGSGQRFYLEPGGPQVSIGADDDADIQLDAADLPTLLATVSWRDMHCWLTPETPALHHREAPLEEAHRLRSGDRFVIGIVELLYYDPIEDTLASIDPDHFGDAPPTGDQRPEPDAESDGESIAPDSPSPDDAPSRAESEAPSSPENDESPERLGAIELTLLAMSIFFLVGTIGLMVVFFAW